MAATPTGQLLENLRALFAAHRVSRNRFAKHAGIPQSTISGLMRALENGGTVRLETLEAMARGFNVTVAQLMSPNLDVNNAESRTPNRLVSRQLGRLTDDFLSSDDDGRQQILSVAEAHALRSVKTHR